MILKTKIIKKELIRVNLDIENMKKIIAENEKLKESIMRKMEKNIYIKKNLKKILLKLISNSTKKEITDWHQAYKILEKEKNSLQMKSLRYQQFISNLIKEKEVVEQRNLELEKENEKYKYINSVKEKLFKDLELLIKEKLEIEDEKRKNKIWSVEKTKSCLKKPSRNSKGLNLTKLAHSKTANFILFDEPEDNDDAPKRKDNENKRNMMKKKERKIRVDLERILKENALNNNNKLNEFTPTSEKFTIDIQKITPLTNFKIDFENCKFHKIESPVKKGKVSSEKQVKPQNPNNNVANNNNFNIQNINYKSRESAIDQYINDLISKQNKLKKTVFTIKTVKDKEKPSSINKIKTGDIISKNKNINQILPDNISIINDFKTIGPNNNIPITINNYFNTNINNNNINPNSSLSLSKVTLRNELNYNPEVELFENFLNSENFEEDMRCLNKSRQTENNLWEKNEDSIILNQLNDLISYNKTMKNNENQIKNMKAEVNKVNTNIIASNSKYYSPTIKRKIGKKKKEIKKNSSFSFKSFLTVKMMDSCSDLITKRANSDFLNYEENKFKKMKVMTMIDNNY